MSEMSWPVVGARLRVPLVWAGVAMIVAGSVADVEALYLAGLVVFVVGFALYLRVGTVRRDPIDVRSPVVGPWLPVNAPVEQGAQPRAARLRPDLRDRSGARAR